MPPLSRLFVRTALVYLLLGFTVGALLLAHKGVPFYPALWRWRPAHVDFLLIGWIVQMVMGVAFWIAPRFWRPPSRGNEMGARLAYVFLNLGVWLVVLGTAVTAQPVLVLAGRLGEVGAAVAFALHLWPRIVPRNFPS